jgi:small subunit ribosomal protein S18
MNSKECFFKKNDIDHVDYKDVVILKKFLNPNGRIMASKRSGVSAKMQRKLSEAIKRARTMSLLPYINR